MLPNGVPPEGEPELGPAVAAVLDELDVVPTRDEITAQFVGVEELTVARALIVEAEAVAGVADPVRPFLDLHPPVNGGGSALAELALAIDRKQRIVREHVLDVRQDQLLVLLLVV